MGSEPAGNGRQLGKKSPSALPDFLWETSLNGCALGGYLQPRTQLQQQQLLPYIEQLAHLNFLNALGIIEHKIPRTFYRIGV